MNIPDDRVKTCNASFFGSTKEAVIIMVSDGIGLEIARKLREFNKIIVTEVENGQFYGYCSLDIIVPLNKHEGGTKLTIDNHPDHMVK